MKYGRLSFIRDLSERSKDHHVVSLWKCDCGKTAKVMKSRVVNGNTKSCGCLAREMQKSTHITHGMRYTKEYNAWSEIKYRCHNENSKDFRRYGSKGISVCKKWRDSFVSFYQDMGNAPTQKHQIDRINTRGNYEPNNCRWATLTEQARNKEASYVWYICGHRFETAKEAGKHFCVTEQTIHKWVKGYFDVRRGSYTPPKKRCVATKRYERIAA